MNSANEPHASNQSLKLRRSKSSEVASRFLSSHSPNKANSSPLRIKSTSTDTRKQNRTLEDTPGGLIGGLWPSSSNSKKLDTLADHLGNERLKDFVERKSYEKRTNSDHTEFSRFINKEINSKENHKPSIGSSGSMRYTTKLDFSKKSNIVPGRYSVDENALYKKSNFESEHETSAASKTKTNSSPSSRKPGIEVSSKYLKEVTSRNRSRGNTSSSDSNDHINPVSADNSPKMSKKFMIRRTNSHGASASQWALSPGRSNSPSISVQPMSFSSLKPATSPSRTRGVEKFLNLGLMDLFKSRKSSALQVVGSGDVECVHRLRLMHNCSIQWRYANAKSDATNRNINDQVQNYLLCGRNSLMKLQHSVVQKKLKLQKEKLEMKINFILQSQMKLLESWADIERQHSSAISMTKECLHSVVCKVPLVQGAKVDIQSASVALRRALDFAASIKSMITSSSPGIEKAALLVSELAEVVAEEKLLLEECLELFRIISILEIQERSLMCYIIELNSQQMQIQQEAQ